MMGPGPGAGPSHAGPPKGWLATLGVLVVMVGLIGLGVAAAAAVANVPDKPILVKDGVVVTIPAQWEFAGRSDDGSAIQLNRGSANIVIAVDQGTAVADVMKQLHDQYAATDGIAVGEIVARTDVRGGAPGALRFAYSGTVPGAVTGGPIEGEVTGVAGSAVTVVFDATSAKGQFVTLSSDIISIIDETMIP